jgi:hypothetical protein
MTLTLTPRSRARKAALAYVGLVTAEARLGESETASHRLTIVPGRLILTPHRGLRRKGMAAHDYAWPAIGMVVADGRFGSSTTLVIDVAGEPVPVHVELDPLDLRWALTECGFRVVDVPHVPVSRVWVSEHLRPLLPASLFTP